MCVQEVTKRLSLPADIRLPENFLARSSISLSPDGQLSRRSRRKSLVSLVNYYSSWSLRFARFFFRRCDHFLSSVCAAFCLAFELFNAPFPFPCSPPPISPHLPSALRMWFLLRISRWSQTALHNFTLTLALFLASTSIDLLA